MKSFDFVDNNTLDILDSTDLHKRGSMNAGMAAVAQAASRGQWDRLDAPKPLLVLHLDVDKETHEVSLRYYPYRMVTMGAGGVLVEQQKYDPFSLSLFRMVVRMVGSRHPGGAFLFEVSLDEYDGMSGRYDVVVGLIGDRRCSSRVRVGIWGEDGAADEIVVAAGELRPAWRRATVFPAINQRFQMSPGPPMTFHVLSGPAVRVLCANLDGDDRSALAVARTFCIPGERSPVAGAMRGAGEVTATPFELPDLTASLYRSAESVGARCAEIKKELMETVWHPRRVAMFMGGVEALDDV